MRSTRALRLIAVAAAVLYAAYWSYTTWERVNTLLLGDLDIEGLFEARFQVFIMTQNCTRNYDALAAAFPGAIPINDLACGDLGPSPIALEAAEASRVAGDDPADPDAGALRYKRKYEAAMRACAAGEKMMCLVLEDDAVLVNDAVTARERLVRNTLSYDTNDLYTWDCSKYGLGFVSGGHTGNKSVCRVVPAAFGECVRDIMAQLRPPFFADIALREGTRLCGLKQARFLLVQHAGYKSTLGHVHNQREDLNPSSSAPQQFVVIPPRPTAI